MLALRPLAQLCAVLRAAADPQRVTLAYADGGVDAYDSPARDALAATLYAAAAAARAPELAPFLGLSEVTPSLPPSLPPVAPTRVSTVHSRAPEPAPFLGLSEVRPSPRRAQAAGRRARSGASARCAQAAQVTFHKLCLPS